MAGAPCSTTRGRNGNTSHITVVAEKSLTQNARGQIGNGWTTLKHRQWLRIASQPNINNRDCNDLRATGRTLYATN
eukprot:3343820-Lingulodinium_polyedra.AAC.1